MGGLFIKGAVCDDVKHLERNHIASKPESAFADTPLDGNAYQCEECMRTFKRKRYLIYHRWSAHNNFEPLTDANVIGEEIKRVHVCQLCGKVYQHKDKLNKHLMNFHELPREKVVRQPKNPGAKTHVCDICGKVLSTKVSLVRHRVCVHNIEDVGAEKAQRMANNPFKCLMCASSYKYKQGLKEHMLSAHDVKMEGRTYNKHGTGRFKCKICSQKLASQFSLKHHLAVKHGVATKRKLRVLPSAQQVEASRGEFQCHVCNLRLTTESSWKRHMVTQHDQKLENAEMNTKTEKKD